MKRKLKKLQKDETGQSFVELALILPILVMLLTLPVDYFRYINTKMILSSAASQGVGQLNFGSVSGDPTAAVKTTMDDYYGDRLDSSKVVVTSHQEAAFTNDYPYMVYQSDRADPNPAKYSDQFDPRDSSFKSIKVKVKATYEFAPITFWGVLFLGSGFDVETPEYTRYVYAGGYTAP